MNNDSKRNNTHQATKGNPESEQHPLFTVYHFDQNAKSRLLPV